MIITPRVRTSVLVCILIVSSSISFAQDLFEMMNDPNANYFEVQRVAERYFKKNGTGKGSGYKLFKRWEYLQSANFDDQGNIYGDPYVIQERKNFKSLNAAKYEQLPESETGNWIEIGPFTWKRTSSWSPGLGRITAIAVESTQQNLIYAGSPGGGLWKSIDAGESWTPLTDNADNLNIWSIAIDPSNNNIVYVGNNASQVLKTTNGGATWTNVGSAISGTPRSILINPSNTSIIMAATTSGIWRSTNAGSSWTKVSSVRTEDLIYKPNSTSVVYACGNEFQKSTNGGTSWTKITNGFVSTERLKVAVSADEPNWVYLIQKSGSKFGRIYRSTNSGTSFSVRVDNSGSSSVLDGILTQAGRDMAIAVSPTNADEVHIAGMNYAKSTNGGSSFSLLATWSSPSDPSYIHADVEVLRFVNNTLWAGSDGGIYRSQNHGDNMEDLTRNGLNVRQLYRIGISQNDPLVIVGGSQDNGTTVVKTIDQEFNCWLGADGMECFVDHSNSNIIYGTSQNGTLYKSTNGGTTRFNLSKPGDFDGNWVTPFEIDPINASIIYSGYSDLYKHSSGGQGGSWQNISNNVDFGGKLNDIAIAPSDNKYIYVARSSKLWRTKNGQATNPTWTEVSGFSGTVSYITVDPNDPEHVVITNSSSRVHESFNAGSSWTNIKGNLPSIGAQCVAMDAESNNGIYVGMQVGVYYTNDNISGWIPFDVGLPNVQTREIEINYSEKQMFIATYGRGIWQSGIYGIETNGVVANFSANKTSTCTNETVTFTNSSTGVGINSYSWDFGAGANPATALGIGPHNVSYTTSGLKTVALTVSNGSNSNNKTVDEFIDIKSCGAFGGVPHPIPGRVQAEEYDEGYNGVGFSDSDASNQGGQFRTDDVDVEETTDVGGGFNVGWTETGEWLEYSVDVASAGTYDFSFRLASLTGAGELSLDLDGIEIIGAVEATNTEGWQTFDDVAVTGVVLPEGEHVIRINFIEGSVNINHFTVSKQVIQGCWLTEEFNDVNTDFFSTVAPFSFAEANDRAIITTLGHDEWDFLFYELNQSGITELLDLSTYLASKLQVRLKASSELVIRISLVDENNVVAQNDELLLSNTVELTDEFQVVEIDFSSYLLDQYIALGPLDSTKIKYISFQINPGFATLPITTPNQTYDEAFAGDIIIDWIRIGEDCQDCNAQANGTAFIDDCGVCAEGNTGNSENETCADCAGLPDGEAFIDLCNECVGGATGLFPNTCATGPVVHYTFEEGIGGETEDQAFVNDGVFSGQPEWGSDGEDGTLTFSGSSDFIGIKNYFVSGANYPGYSVLVWIRTNESGNQIIASFDRSDFWRLEINGDGAGDGQVGWDVVSDGAITDFGSTARIDDGEWHHVVGVFDNGNMLIYIDGQLDGSIAASGSLIGNASQTRYGFVGIGSEAATELGTTGPNNYFNGDMDEFMIFEYALTAQQILDIKNETDPITRYTIQIESSGEGTVSPTGQVIVEQGQNLELQMNANTGSGVYDVLVGGSSVGAHNSYVLQDIREDQTVEVDFRQIDCNEEIGGNAYVDACDNCAGGTTGVIPVDDPAGCVVASLSDVRESDVQLFPIPAHDAMEIVIPGEFSSAYRLIDIEGVTVQKGTIQNNGKLQFVGLAPGVYVLELIGEHKVVQKQFIIE